MTEQEMNGQLNAIDTEYERSIIEYRPKVSYEPNRPFTVNYQPEVVTEVRYDDGVGAVQLVEKPAEQFVRFGELSTQLNELILDVEQKMKDLVIAITPGQLAAIQQASPNHSVQVPLITFADYKQTFEDSEEPGNSLVQDIVNDYASDVDGNLDLELYEDMKESLMGLEETYFLYKETILKNYMDGDLPASPGINKSFTEQLNQAVLQQKKWLQNVESVCQTKESDYYKSLREDYGTSEFFRISEEYNRAKRPYDLSLREEKTVQELMSVVDSSLDGTEDAAASIKSSLAIGSEIDPELVMKVLENQANTKEELSNLLKLTQLSLKLQINNQMEEKKQYRDILKNINNLSRKKRTNDELLSAYELRGNMYLSMYDTLQYLESPSKKSGLELFLNQVAGGLSLVSDQYSSFVNEAYMMNVADYEVRKEKIDKVRKKEDARVGYSLVVDHL